MRQLARILGFAKELWPYYVGIIAASVLTATTGLLTPFIISAATDRVVEATTGQAAHSISTVIWLAVALLAADLTNTLVSNWGGYLGDVMAAKLKRTLSVRYYRKLLELPQRYFDSELTGKIISRLNRSITETTNFLNAASNNFMPVLLTTLAALVITAFYSPWLAVLLLIIFPTYTWLTALTTKRWQRLEGEKNTEIDIAGGRFAEVIGQVRVVKSFVTELHELKTFSDRYDTTIGLTQRQSRFWHGMDIARRGALNVIFFAIHALIFVQTIQGQYSIGTMVLLIQLVALTRQPVVMMSYLVDTAQKAIAGSKDFFEVIALEPDRDELAAQPTEPVDGKAGEIVFDNVSFSYDEGPEVLHDVSFTVRPGERVALVGESGGGKTTLVNLLLGLYPLSAGEVTVSGLNTSEIPLGTLRRRIGVVFQDASLFSGTIRENIAYGKLDATDDEVRHAAQQANADRFIEAFPDGYGSLVGERGLKLSGGQKQRVSVARAILKNAPILVLDEATSALDTKAERAVQQGLDHLMTGRTSIIIAHRLSTIASVDRIVTLRNGRVDEIGTPAELAQSGGIYAELLSLQGQGSKTAKKKLQEAYDISG